MITASLGLLIVGVLMPFISQADLFGKKKIELPFKEIYQKSTPYCSDSDGGVHYYVKGKIFGPNESGTGFSWEEDSCSDKKGDEGLQKGDYVAEKSCSQKGGYVHTQWYKCKNICYKGACSNVPTMDSILKEEIPLTWIYQFMKDFQFVSTVYSPELGVAWYPESPPLVAKNYTGQIIKLSDAQKNVLIPALLKMIYRTSRLDSYFTKPLPFTGGKSYYDWLKDSVKNISFNLDPKGVATGGGGYISLPLTFADNDDLFDVWYDASWGMGLLEKLTIIIHEARHSNKNDGVEIGHVTCSDQTPGDANLKMMGGYGASIMFVHWVKHFLPEVMIDDINAFGPNAFSVCSWMSRLCSSDLEGFKANDCNDPHKFLDAEDQQWLLDISGYPLE